MLLMVQKERYLYDLFIVQSMNDLWSSSQSLGGRKSLAKHKT